jgi:hypothetical protein
MGSMVVLYSGREGIKDDRWSARVAAAVQKLCGVVEQLVPEHVRYVAERDPQFGMYTLGRSDACICTTAQLGRNAASPNHMDPGDRAPMTAMVLGDKGAVLTFGFPSFGWAVTLRPGDLMTFNSAEYEHVSAEAVGGDILTLGVYNTNLYR